MSLPFTPMVQVGFIVADNAAGRAQHGIISEYLGQLQIQEVVLGLGAIQHDSLEVIVFERGGRILILAQVNDHLGVLDVDLELASEHAHVLLRRAVLRQLTNVADDYARRL